MDEPLDGGEQRDEQRGGPASEPARRVSGGERPTLILASTSRYRRELLQRLRLPFDVLSPGVDEAPLGGEAPSALARRLARAKAEAVAARYPGAVVIGSDQVCELEGQAIGKPGTHERAVQQLQRLSGRRAVFHTAVCVLRHGPPREGRYEGQALVPVTVRFRRLGSQEIERYLRAEQPYDCAGSAKCETLGIALVEAIESDDPTALVGLPLIATARLLRDAGVDPLG
ncbi:MAG: septum formation protein Maf [Rubrivivax sp.]|nr:septum formation protein Maf [Rubrivivax sp.]